MVESAEETSPKDVGVQAVWGRRNSGQKQDKESRQTGFRAELCCILTKVLWARLVSMASMLLSLQWELECLPQNMNALVVLLLLLLNLLFITLWFLSVFPAVLFALVLLRAGNRCDLLLAAASDLTWCLASRRLTWAWPWAWLILWMWVWT